MRLRIFVIMLALSLAGGVAWAQETGEIFGKVTDTSGAVVPGATVTLTSPVLLKPMTAISSETGTYRFPRIPIGTYAVKFELTGFKTVVKDGIRIEIGFNAQINGTLEVTTVQETVTVSGATPLVDLKDTSKGARFNQEALQSIPSARDPWVLIEQAPGVAMDRQNVGGSASGQQSNFVARGASFSQQKWNLDGVDITDMSATGGSPGYFDFDSFEEMQVTTGGSDASMQTAGVSVNIVTKSGTDRFRGSGRYYITSDKVESVNLTDAIRLQGASSGNPIQNISDYGFEVGGPIVKGRAWFWGAYGKQDVKVGINNFYSNSAGCSGIRNDYLNKMPQAQFVAKYSVEELWNCLNTDLTTLTNYNLKLGVEPFKNNRFSWYNNFAGKVRNARGADDLHPIESTNRQMGVPSSYGAWGWKSGLNGTWKASDQHIFSDRLMTEVIWAHVGNNFTMAYHDDSLATVQPMYEVTNGNYARSYSQNIYVRPTNSVDVVANYFKPGFLGGDHAFKVGYKWRSDEALSITTYGGNVMARFNSPNADFSVPYSARFYRDSRTDYYLFQQAGYLQDTYTRKRLTINAGVRWDRQHDTEDPSSVPASPFMGQTNAAGVPFTFLPAMTFAGAKDGVIWNDFGPRVQVTYDLKGDGKSVVKASYARYYSQRGTGDLSGTYNTVGATYVEFPWNDKNGDKFVQMGEITSYTLMASGNNYNAKDPANPVSANKNDPNLKNEGDDEFLVGFDKQIGPDVGVSASYIYRKYNNIRTTYYYDSTTGALLLASNYKQYTYTPDCSTAPAGARCNPVTFYGPVDASGAPANRPTSYIYMNQPDYYRNYNGFEVAVRKRMSHRWLANASFAYNSAKRFYTSSAAYQDPTNIDKYNGAQYAQESTSSGLDNIFVNASWVGRISGAYQLPWYDIGVAGFYNARGGYPFLPSVNVVSSSLRKNDGTIQVLLDPLGDVRLPTFQTVDFRVDKTFRIKSARFQASMDVFNLMNSNTVLSQRRNQNASNANMISSILAPRVLRFGVRMTF